MAWKSEIAPDHIVQPFPFPHAAACIPRAPVPRPGLAAKGQPWSEEEHRAFLRGLEVFGKGSWSAIAQQYVTTRTSTQVASHAQKFFDRQRKDEARKRKRPSILDIASADAVIEFPGFRLPDPKRACAVERPASMAQLQPGAAFLTRPLEPHCGESSAGCKDAGLAPTVAPPVGAPRSASPPCSSSLLHAPPNAWVSVAASGAGTLSLASLFVPPPEEGLDLFEGRFEPLSPLILPHTTPDVADSGETPHTGRALETHVA